MAGLGLDQVEADPNALPDGKWPGIVTKSEIVVVKKNNTVAHVITYKVTEGEKTGAVRSEFFNLGKDPVYAEDGKTIVSYTVTMSEAQKPWYKKRYVDLGIPEAQVTQTEPAALVGKEVIFGTKKNDGFINISFVELRNKETAGFNTDAVANATTPASAPVTEQSNLGGLI
jgi:hypothetical protein